MQIRIRFRIWILDSGFNIKPTAGFRIHDRIQWDSSLDQDSQRIRAVSTNSRDPIGFRDSDWDY